MKVQLVVVKGRPEGMVIPIPMPQFLIGRDPRCNLRPGSESISKLHCAILQRAGGVYVRDLKSTNGTFLNNDRVHEEVKVKDGDLLRVGPLVLAFRIEVASSLPASPSSTEEDQAVSWLLDYNPSARRADQQEIGSKTAILDLSGGAKATTANKASEVPETSVEEPAKQAREKPRPRTATAEVAGDLLEKLLAPTPRKKKG